MTDILIAVDLQNDFIDGALGTHEAREIISAASDKIRNFKGMIFATKDTHDETYMQTREGKYLPVPHCVKNTKGWEHHPEIAAALGEKTYTTIEKTTFGSMDLVQRIEMIQKSVGIKNIELIGLCTDICVVSNALLLKAAFPETEIIVDSACCAGVTPEAHAAALTTMRSCQINVR